MADLRLAALLMLLCAGVSAQTYPTRPIRILTGSVGSNGDVISRLLAHAVSPSLGQPIVVENRPGGLIGQLVARAPPDGHTLLVTGASFWLQPFVQDDVPWDPLRDFESVSLLTSSPNLVVVHPSVPAKSIGELIALAKAKPGQLNYGAGTVGSTPHLAGELFNSMAQVNIVAIPYRGIAPAMNDLIGGQVLIMFPNANAVAAHLKSGRVRGLAVASAKPTALFPDLPTVSSSGLEGYEAEVLNGMFAPAKTPSFIIDRINREMAHALQRPEIKEKLFHAGMETAGGRPEQLRVAVKREMAVWGPLIRERGIRK